MSEKMALPLDDPLIGLQLANFRIERLLKRGGMAQIYYGWDVMLQRPVAIKVIDVRYRSSPTYAERFLAEARAMASWGHPNIVQIHYADEQDRLYYFVMEYVNGLDLSELMARYAADHELMPYHDVIRIGREVAHALDYAHEHGVIHRDVKPSNVMVARNGRVLLTDFGLALTIKDGSQGEIFGTPQYIAPEQAIRSTAAVPQSDLYSLAVILYEMLTGSLPFDDPSPTSLAIMHVNEDPPSPRYFNPHLSPEVESVLLRALRKAPEERYQSGIELIDRLELALQVDEDNPGSTAHRLPLPAHSETGEDGAGRLVSRISVLEKIAWQSGLDDMLRDTPDPDTKPTTPPPAGHVSRFLILLTVAMGILLVMLLLNGGIRRNSALPEATAVSPAAIIAVEASATSTAALPTATAVPITTTPLPLTPTAEPLPTLPPTATSVPVSVVTENAEITAVPPTATFNGPSIRFFYDRNSFYAWNPGSTPIAIRSLSFVALDETGNPTSYAFRGRMWAEFYEELEAGGCDAIEPLEAPAYLQPDACDSYNSTVTPPLDSKIIFWTSRPGIVAFRVMWNGQTIGECPFVAGICQLNLPSK
ncbi:MAG: serine/threonine-protein kinase [Chloroflexota bacterium]